MLKPQEKQSFDLPMQFIDLQTQRRRIEGKINDAITRVLEKGAFIMGPDVAELEQKLAEFCGAKHCVACSNGTDALALGLFSKGIRPGDAIIVPSFTFASTAEVVAWLGATAIFADSDPRTFNMDPASLKQCIVKAKSMGLNVKGIIPVDLFGLPADYDAIEAIAKEEGLWIMADSAQGFGGDYKGRTTGSIGDLATTSFFPAKPLGCYGDGGAVFTDDEETFALLRSFRVHGKGTDKYDNVRIGMNARLDTMQAAILIEKLAIYADEIDARNKVADYYSQNLEGAFQTPHVPEGLRSVWAQYTLILDDAEQRAPLMAHLKEHGIPSVVYYPRPLHMQTAYKRFPAGHESGSLPVSEDMAQRVMSLPMHPYLTQDQQDYICETVKAFFKA